MFERSPFHLAIPVDDLEAAREFYGQILGCPEGRSAEHWIDFDLAGHQLVAHLDAGARRKAHNPVDGRDVPVPHFGLVLGPADFDRLVARLRERGVSIEIGPETRFADRIGEQRTLFFRDPAGNALEFKTFRDPEDLFRKDAP